MAEPPQSQTEPQNKEADSSNSWFHSLRRRLGLGGSDTVREAIEDALATNGGNEPFSLAEREMLQRTLRFGTLRVDDVMVPRADIIALDEAEPVSDLLRLFDDAGVSRIPVFRETLDDPRGMVHVKDLLRWLIGDSEGRPATEGRASGAQPCRPKAAGAPGEQTRIDLSRTDLGKSVVATKLRRPVLFVPPSLPAINLLIRMQTTRIHMALVVDEYGGTEGLVTIEDLVEQIVGDIEDEHDEAEMPMIAKDPRGGFVTSARVPVEDLQARMGLHLMSPEQVDEIDTLGGLVFSLVGHVPARGEIIRHPSGVEFEILDADARRIKRVRVHLPRGTDAAKIPATTANAAIKDASAELK